MRLSSVWFKRVEAKLWCMLRSPQTDHGLGLVVILADCVICGVLGEGLPVGYFCFAVKQSYLLAECAFEGQGGLALSSGKLRSAGSPLMTIVDVSQVGQFERGLSGSQFFLIH